MRVKCEVRNVKCKVLSGEWTVWSVNLVSSGV